MSKPAVFNVTLAYPNIPEPLTYSFMSLALEDQLTVADFDRIAKAQVNWIKSREGKYTNYGDNVDVVLRGAGSITVECMGLEWHA